jgi:hypothetical protein
MTQFARYRWIRLIRTICGNTNRATLFLVQGSHWGTDFTMWKDYIHIIVSSSRLPVARPIFSGALHILCAPAYYAGLFQSAQYPQQNQQHSRISARATTPNNTASTCRTCLAGKGWNARRQLAIEPSLEKDVMTNGWLALLQKSNSSRKFSFKGMILRPLLYVSFPVIFFSGFMYGSIVCLFNVLNGTASLILTGAPYDFSASMVGLSYLSCLIGVFVW